MPDEDDLTGDEGEILSIAPRDAQRLRHCCARASMVAIGVELDEMLRTKDMERCFVSIATLNALHVAMANRDETTMTVDVARFARRISNLASSLSWAKNVEIGEDRCDA